MKESLQWCFTERALETTCHSKWGWFPESNFVLVMGRDGNYVGGGAPGIYQPKLIPINQSPKDRRFKLGSKEAESEEIMNPRDCSRLPFISQSPDHLVSPIVATFNFG